MEIVSSRRLRIENKAINLPNGIKKETVIVHPGNAVALLPIEGKRCKLVKQYRYAIDQYIFEVPAGVMEPGEDPLMTAHRELIEETGFAAMTFIEKGFIYTTPGFSDEKIFLFEARDLSPSQDYRKDDDEIIEVAEVAISNLPAMIRSGTIVDAKTICLIYRCLWC